MRAITVRPDVNIREFETVMTREVSPAVKLLRRNVANTRHRLVKSDNKLDGHHLYAWTSVADLVGGDQEPVTPPIPEDIARKIERYGKVATFSRVNPWCSRLSMPPPDPAPMQRVGQAIDSAWRGTAADASVSP